MRPRTLALLFSLVLAALPVQARSARHVFVGQVITLMPEVGALEVRQEYAPISMNFTANPGTRVQRHRDRILFSELKVGDRVKVWYDGGRLERIRVLDPKPSTPQESFTPKITKAP